MTNRKREQKTTQKKNKSVDFVLQLYHKKKMDCTIRLPRQSIELFLFFVEYDLIVIFIEFFFFYFPNKCIAVIFKNKDMNNGFQYNILF